MCSTFSAWGVSANCLLNYINHPIYVTCKYFCCKNHPNSHMLNWFLHPFVHIELAKASYDRWRHGKMTNVKSMNIIWIMFISPDEFKKLMNECCFAVPVIFITKNCSNNKLHEITHYMKLRIIFITKNCSNNKTSWDNNTWNWGTFIWKNIFISTDKFISKYIHRYLKPMNVWTWHRWIYRAPWLTLTNPYIHRCVHVTDEYMWLIFIGDVAVPMNIWLSDEYRRIQKPHVSISRFGPDFKHLVNFCPLLLHHRLSPKML
jgi:hypothetical protein